MMTMIAPVLRVHVGGESPLGASTDLGIHQGAHPHATYG